MMDSEIIVGGRNDRGDDAEIIHDETGRYGAGDSDGEGEPDRTLGEWSA